MARRATAKTANGLEKLSARLQDALFKMRKIGWLKPVQTLMHFSKSEKFKNSEFSKAKEPSINGVNFKTDTERLLKYVFKNGENCLRNFSF